MNILISIVKVGNVIIKYFMLNILCTKWCKDLKYNVIIKVI